jgi:N-acetylglutamate synthase-like GNAT family acetyltransferase
MHIRKAKPEDRGTVMDLLRKFGLYDEFRTEEFIVAEECGVVGCVRLTNLDNAYELCSLAVEKKHQMRGIGRALVKACLAGVTKPVYCLTYIPGYFIDKGFKIVRKDELPDELTVKAAYCDGSGREWVAMVKR